MRDRDEHIYMIIFFEGWREISCRVGLGGGDQKTNKKSQKGVGGT